MRAILLLLTMLLPPCTVRADRLVLATEPYPPFVVVEGDRITGSGIALVDLIMKDTGQDYRVEVTPWARAIALAQQENMRCVFAAARTPDREALFKWISPLLVVRSYLVAAAGSGVSAATLDDARRHVVGTHRNDFSEALLKKLGFPRIDLAADFNLSVRKLVNRRVDLVPMTEESLATLTANGEKLEKIVLLSQESLGIACNTGVPDGLIGRMNDNLQRLRTTGALERILHHEGKAAP